ncbi:MAG: penicillin-binding protein 2 [Victivallales bacterium]|nr:penicillin-binding protein 2 [Victivallales bacterium]
MKGEHQTGRTGGNAPVEVMHRRVLVCTMLIVGFFCLLALRLWQVQVLQGPEHLRRAQRQSVRFVRLNSVRGRIFVDGQAVVDNQAHYDLVFYVSEMRQPGRQTNTIQYVLETERALSEYLGREATLDAGQVQRQLNRQPVLPMTVMRDLTPKELSAIAERLPVIPGVDVQPRVERVHPFPGLLTHLLGYTGRDQPNPDELSEDYPRAYTMMELTGRNGLERAFDQELRGQAGMRLVVVDSIGYARENVGEVTPPTAGNDLFLTIDLKAQQIAEELLQGYHGALVLMDADTGAVLAMASAPSYDLSTLSGGDLARLSQDVEGRPLLNRATRGLYTPGSIMKPLLALCALERCPEVAHGRYECTGKYMIGNHGIRCARTWGHGELDIQEAITVSCNPFFIHLGLEVGIDDYAAFLMSAGIGEPTGIEIGDAAGVRPERAVAQRFWRRGWLAVDTAYASLGQGAITITPLQAASYTAAIANGGSLLRPFLVKEIRTPNGNLIMTGQPAVRNRLPVSPQNLQLVQQAMRRAVTEKDGSAHGLADACLPLCAKTGTAEVGEGENRYKNTWVIAFGPADHPQYALACVIERGQSGGRTAVPIAFDFFQRWLGAE